VKCGEPLGSNPSCPECSHLRALIGEPERPEREEGPSPNEKPEQAEGKPEGEAEPEIFRPVVSTPNGTTVPNARGASMVTDVTTAPQAIQAWEEIKERFEGIKNELSQLADDAASTADSMGDFAAGSEPDAVGAIETARDNLGSAEERVDTVISDLHDEWDEHIAAAEGRTAGAHAAFQEA
jgi:hypothetical protein